LRDWNRLYDNCLEI